MAVLPDDIFLEILSWLPANQVARLRILSKSICDGTQGRYFSLLQTRHADADVGVFLGNYNFGRIRMILADDHSRLPPAYLQFLNASKKHIIGSGGGLVVFLQRDGPDASKLFLCNPVLQKTIPLGRPGRAELGDCGTAGAVVLRGEDDDLGVVYITGTPEWSSSAEIWILSSREKTWKLVYDKIFVGPRNLKYHRPVVGSDGFVFLASGNGTAFRCEPYIVRINVRDGSSGLLDVPKEIRNPSDESEFEIGGHGSSTYLSLVLCNRASEYVIWDIKDGDKWAWKKREMKVSMVSMGLRPRPVRVFSFINGETLVFATLNRVYVYELNAGGGRLKRIGRIGEGFPYMCPYANTLQPCE